MRSNSVQTLSLIKTSFNSLPPSTPNKVILPLIYCKKYFYSTLPLFSQELTSLTDLTHLENVVESISKFVDFDSIRRSYYYLFYSVLGVFVTLFGGIVLINYFTNSPIVSVIVLLVLLLTFIFMFIRIVDYSYRFYSATLLHKVFLTQGY